MNENRKIEKIQWIIWVLMVIFIIGVVGLISIAQINRIADPLREDIPRELQEITESSRLNSIAQFIRYYDEVLTQSARNYAFTSDELWRERYIRIVPELDLIIKEAIFKGDEEDSEFFVSVDAANLALVKMEEKAIALVDGGNTRDAVIILESDEYWEQKAIYKKGLVDYVSRKGFRYDETLETSTLTIQKASSKVKELLELNKKITTILVSVMVGVALSFGIAAVIEFRKKRRNKK